jgi:hypothetical protein
MSPRSPGKSQPSETSPSPASPTPAAVAPDPPTPPIDAPNPDAAKAAFEMVLPLLRAIPRDQLKSTRSNLQDAALYAYGVARRLVRDGLRPRFAALPSDLFDIIHFDRLETVAAAAWYAQVQLDSAMATTTEAKVPLSLLQESSETKDRMLKVVEYHLTHRSETLGREIADIRSGTGHADMASDLSRLRILYVEQRAFLPQTGGDPHYRPEDAESAGRLSSAILAELAAARTKAQEEAQALAARAWTLLVTTYDEVADAGRLILKREGGADLFPSLYTAGRAAPSATRRRTPKPPAPTSGTPTPQTPPTGTSTPTK